MNDPHVIKVVSRNASGKKESFLTAYSTSSGAFRDSEDASQAVEFKTKNSAESVASTLNVYNRGPYVSFRVEALDSKNESIQVQDDKSQILEAYNKVISEGSTQFFGASDADERSAGAASSRLASDRSFGGGRILGRIWKNGTAFKNNLKKYYLKPDLMKQIGNGRITIQPGNHARLTFKCRDGFVPEDQLLELLQPVMNSFEKAYHYKLGISEYDGNSFVLEYYRDETVEESSDKKIPKLGMRRAVKQELKSLSVVLDMLCKSEIDLDSSSDIVEGYLKVPNVMAYGEKVGIDRNQLNDFINEVNALDIADVDGCNQLLSTTSQLLISL